MTAANCAFMTLAACWFRHECCPLWLLIKLENKQIEKDEPVSFESLAAFRKSLKGLIEKGELDKNVQTAIIKKVVHKITVKPNGFEIHFHVGNTYYARELGTDPSSRFFSFERNNRPSTNLKKSAKARACPHLIS